MAIELPWKADTGVKIVFAVALATTRAIELITLLAIELPANKDTGPKIVFAVEFATVIDTGVIATFDVALTTPTVVCVTLA